MTHPDITALEAHSRDYSETPRRVLFVLGSGKSPALEVFEAAEQQRSTSIDPHHLAEMAAGRRRSLTFCTPMQMVLEIVRKGVVHQRLRPMPASLWKGSSRKSARPVLGSMRATRQSSCSQLIVTVMAVSSRGSREKRLVWGRGAATRNSSIQHPIRKHRGRNPLRDEALQAKDRELEKALVRVASEARQVPSEKLQTLWRDNLTGFYKTSADPNEQARAS